MSPTRSNGVKKRLKTVKLMNTISQANISIDKRLVLRSPSGWRGVIGRGYSDVFDEIPSRPFLPVSLLLAPIIFWSRHLQTKCLCRESGTPLIFTRSSSCPEPHGAAWDIGLHKVLIKTLSDWLRTAEAGLLCRGEAALSHAPSTTTSSEAAARPSSLQEDRVVYSDS